MRGRFVAVGVAISLSACASPPEKIGAATLPVSTYATLSCQELDVEHRKISGELAISSSAQTNAATGDAVGVFLIGIPVSSAAGGNKEALISLQKGQLQSIELQRANKRCDEPQTPSRPVASRRPRQ